MLTHLIHGEYDGEAIEICTIEDRNGDYKYPARDVVELKFDEEEFSPCIIEGDKLFMGVMGGNYNERVYHVFWVVAKDGTIASFKRASHLYHWLANTER